MLNRQESVRQITRIILGNRRSMRHKHREARIFAGRSDTTMRREMTMSFEECVGSADDQFAMFGVVGRLPNMTRTSRDGGNEQ